MVGGRILPKRELKISKSSMMRCRLRKIRYQKDSSLFLLINSEFFEQLINGMLLNFPLLNNDFSISTSIVVSFVVRVK